MLGDQGPRGDVIDTRGNRDIHAQCGTLRLVLLAGTALGCRTGADELEAGILDGLDELVVLGHEAVTGKDRIVAVVLGNLNDLADTLNTLFLGCTGVIGNPVDTAVVGQHAQFRRERVRIDDRILLGEQDAVMADAHLFVNGHGLQTNRATADDQRLEIFTGEGADPLRIRLAQATIAVNQWIVNVVIILCHCLSPNRNLGSLN